VDRTVCDFSVVVVCAVCFVQLWLGDRKGSEPFKNRYRKTAVENQLTQISWKVGIKMEILICLTGIIWLKARLLPNIGFTVWGDLVMFTPQ